MQTSEERRKSQRFPLGLPLEVKWQEETSEVQEPATLRDISATGIYFLFEHELKPQSKVEFYVHLKMEGVPAAGVLLHCVGSIVRVEPNAADPNRVGVAARIDQYRFLRPEETPGELDPTKASN